MENFMKKDVSQLIRGFTEKDTFEFDAFQVEWIRLKFYSYHALGREGVVRTYQLEILLNVVTEVVTDSNNSLLHRVGGIYTWYALYYTQPSSSVKIRLSIKDWKVVESLHSAIRAAGYHDADYILCNLKSFAAFYMCVSRHKMCIGQSGDLSSEQLFKAKEMTNRMLSKSFTKKIQECIETQKHYEALKASVAEHLPPQLVPGTSSLDSIQTRDDSPLCDEGETDDNEDDYQEDQTYLLRRQSLLHKAYTTAPRPIDKRRV